MSIQIQGYIGKEKPSASKMNTIENMTRPSRDTSKPHGGIWTSSVKEVNGKAHCSWIRHRRDTDWKIWDNEEMYLLYPKNNIKLFTVSSSDDLERLYNNYWREDYKCYEPREAVFIDFEKLDASGYDGLRVTESAVGLVGGWDCESTVWFSWSFKSVKSIQESERFSGIYYR